MKRHSPGSGVTAPPPGQAHQPGLTAGPNDDSWTDADAIRFWTPARMASATDPARPSAPDNQGTTSRTPALRGTGPAAGITVEHFMGIKSVGVLFSYTQEPTTGEMRAHSCSASVVDSPGHNLILTAAHCSGGHHSVFVPKYDNANGLNKQPYGFFRVDKWFKDPRYDAPNTKDKTSDLDFSFAALADSSSGEKVQNAVGGANQLVRTPSFNNNVTMVGYPKASHDSADRAVRCPTQTWALPNFYQIQAVCSGMYGGVSGGPWFSKIDWAKGTGQIIGNVGGYFGGGNDQNVDWLTYSPVHGDQFFRLYDDARHDRTVKRPDPYKQPPLPYSMGSGKTWQHASLMASGDFNGKGHSDMIVVWSDGETTLYSSDGNGHFTGERQLLAKNSLWKNAKTITAGDFTGSNQFDLLVRWVDGEVTLYGDVGTKGLNWSGTQMIKPNDLWKNATQIAAGRFNASKYVTDLIVRWVDGEVTLYTGVGAGTFGNEHKLKDKNDTWRHATLLTSGEYSGSAKWDLMVQWSDGELDNYVNTTTSGLGTEQRIQNPNDLWTHNKVMTTGDFTPNRRTDDLVIRWSDGETTMYADTSAAHLGTEHNLVPKA
ncbi:FG-GAP-like repeat-containing protein [Streptomyces sp. HUAS TT20]|uniref:FG-GAP-like repeat-containing protein n=1 Tax=Streptomyces sp. HUAS TT20 TaxID=3447509 RepID=UPI0021D9BFC0|nr:FG-GAP-like repeat-containing protein [Streptomyces sp. HUAS 15-9]UXY29568.1 FG-GAP-like repeat-containing protein [Streptomyces sp. HUAS 15-9]